LIATPTAGVALGGTYTLTLGSTSGALGAATSRAALQTALEGLSGVGSGNVRVFGPDLTTAGGTYLVLFMNGRAHQNLATLTAAGSLTGTTPAVTPVTVLDGQLTGNEVQSINFFGNVIQGYYTLNFNGVVTTPIAYNATAAQVQAALEALGTIGTGNVVVTG